MTSNKESMGMTCFFHATTDADLKKMIEQPDDIHASSGGDDERKAKQPSETLDVDKAWHGIHFLLTDDPWEGDGPLAFILNGGCEIQEEIRGFASAEVEAIASALKDITPEQLYAKADQAQFAANDIYPNIWDSESKEECIGYVTNYFGELKQFIQKLADSNRAMIVSIG